MNGPFYMGEESIVEEVTNDFVASFAANPQMYQGPFARLVARILPRGVNPSDPLVQTIVQRCRNQETLPVAGNIGQ